MAQPNYDVLIGQMEKAAESARAANEKRYEQAMSLYEGIVQRYQPGGTFEAAHEQLLQTQKKRDVAGGQQALVSSGLFGTTRASGLGRAWEEQVGGPSRLQRSDILAQRLTQAEIGKAGLVERREDVGPSYSDIFNMAQAAGATGGKTTSFTTAPHKTLHQEALEWDARASAERQASSAERIAELQAEAAKRQPTVAREATPTKEGGTTQSGGTTDKGGVSQWIAPSQGPRPGFSPSYVRGKLIGWVKRGGVAPSGKTQIATTSEYAKIQEEMRKKYPGRGY